MTTLTLPIENITADPRVQPRVELDAFLVDDYAERMRSGVQFPAVVVFQDGESYWLADGFHRHHAAREAGLPSLLADVRQGSMREAILYSVGANTTHGKRRTNADKRRAVTMLLEDSEWRQWSDSRIAEQAAVSPPLVAKLRSELSIKDLEIAQVRRVERGGTTYEMKTVGIGSAKRLSPEARALLKDSPIADDPRQIARLATRPAEVQLRASELVARGDVPHVEGALRHLAYEGKVERSLADVAKGQFPIIYADPPWKFDSGDGLEGMAVDQYPTLSTNEICGLRVRERVADNAAIFLWSTNAHLPDALRVLDAWGFRYVSNLVWVKNTCGLGQYFRGKHELLLLGVRGSFVPKESVPSVLFADARGHSVKPDEVYELIEQMYPGLTYLELFTRKQPHSRPRWVGWGNEPELEMAQSGSAT